eukprot:11487113-Heterocapsa_arctica.AAC.1
MKFRNVHRSSMGAHSTAISGFKGEGFLERVQAVPCIENVVNTHKVVGTPGVNEPKLDNLRISAGRGSLKLL